ncbi:hypothetical protein LTR17_023653 [Elasticomyces elasticus]|nr:hypothetical protein LTR17_023653 [Elasticomyces elasticus]
MALTTASLTLTNKDTTWTETATYSNLGPLTTKFGAPHGCDQQGALGTWQMIDTQGPSSTYTHFSCSDLTADSVDPAPHPKFLGDPNCLPSGNLVSSLLDQTNQIITHFSPGIHCPTGWATSGIVTQPPNGGYVNVSSGLASLVEYITLAAPTSGTHIFCCPS